MPEQGSAAPIRVVIADDDQLYLRSLRELIDQQPELAVVGAAVDGADAVELVDALAPDAAVIDLHMPRLHGVQALARLRHDHPNLCLIALTGDPEPELHRAASRAGADGVFLKGELVEGLLDRLSALGSDGERVSAA
jgi:two-component system nitrate/nitrite response regulator NarL